eukprot:scpid61810/ scgid29739/ Uncharacterized protein C20orf4 homolog
MDQDTAKRLLAEGAVLLIEDAPQGLEFGIDCHAWRVGPRFRGVKMIPPGFHFVFYSAVNTEGQAAPRMSFCHVFERQEVVVKRWNSVEEDLMDEVLDEERRQRIRADLKNLDRFLGAYPFEDLRKWTSLTNHVSKKLIERVEPVNKRVCSVMQFEATPFVPKASAAPETPAETTESPAEAEEPKCEEDLLPAMKPLPDTIPRFSTFPEHNFPAGSSAAEISQHSMDRSYVLETMSNSLHAEERLLGELQLAFVFSILGHVYESFEHWRKLVEVFATCDSAMRKQPKLFCEFIAAVHFQLRDLPEDFFLDVSVKNNFFAVTLQRFFAAIEEDSRVLDKSLVSRAAAFKQYLSEKFEWEFEDDDAPVVVEL